ncbi:hypothetical protein GCM10010250_35940 [Streptomyces althioticus]|nr:hypothetical protein GCM10010250_35940 [Streptomyces althioticus]
MHSAWNHVAGGVLGEDGEPGVLRLAGRLDQGDPRLRGRDERHGVEGVFVKDVREVDAGGARTAPPYYIR